MKFPNHPIKGRNIRDDFRDLLNYVRASRITNVVGGSVRQTPNGTTLVFKPGDKNKAAAASSCAAWKPNIRLDGANWKVYLSFGTINNVAPSNWDTEQIILAGSDYWPTLTCTTSNGEITGVTTSFETSAPGSTAVANGSPPSSFTVTLGMISSLQSCMLYTKSLNATAAELFRASRGSLSFAGQEPFERYFRWSVTEA